LQNDARITTAQRQASHMAFGEIEQPFGLFSFLSPLISPYDFIEVDKAKKPEKDQTDDRVGLEFHPNSPLQKLF
jgi:hypothetical protein